MKTVLFIDKGDTEVYDSYLRYDFILDEYRKNEVFSVCSWHPEGMSVSTAIPDLPALLGDDKEWRAIVVSDLRRFAPDPSTDRHFDNLFDFTESYDVGTDVAFAESQRPIVRLAQMLGGFPEKAAIQWIEQAKNSEDVINTAGNAVQWNAQDLLDTASIDEADIEFALPPELYHLLERYRLGVTRPQSIFLISPRDVDEDLMRTREISLLQEKKEEDERRRKEARERNRRQADAIADVDSDFEEEEGRIRAYLT